LDDEHEPLEKPPWVGDEVTHDVRYLNANLVQRPYSSWAKTEHDA
jgi:adenylate cyclase